MNFIDTFVDPSYINVPTDLIFGPDNNLYVATRYGNGVTRYNGTTGAYIDYFVVAASGGLNQPFGLVFGPDGNLYVTSFGTDFVPRYNGTTGAYIDAFVVSGSGGLDGPHGLVFGSDGNLYVASGNTHQVLRYNGTTGAFIDVFVTAGSGGLNSPKNLSFGSDGNLYVTSFGTDTVLRYNGTTGAFIDVFVTVGSGGLSGPLYLVFGPDNNLYVSSSYTAQVLRYNGTTGAFIDAAVAAGSGGLSGPLGLVFGPDGNLYVTSYNNNQVLRYGETTVAQVTTQAESNVLGTTATGNGTIVSTGGANPDTRGIVYSTTSHALPGDVAPASSGYSGLVNETGGSFGTGAYTESLTGLSLGTTYYARTYIHNSVGYYYGGEVSFTTLALPTVTTQAVSGISATALTVATGNGTISATGGVGCSERGMVYDIAPHVLPGNVAPSSSGYAGLSNATGGSFGVGAFTDVMTGLSLGITYYVRAYVRNTTGYAYGAEVSFNTLTFTSIDTTGFYYWYHGAPILHSGSAMDFAVWTQNAPVVQILGNFLDMKCRMATDWQGVVVTTVQADRGMPLEWRANYSELLMLPFDITGPPASTVQSSSVIPLEWLAKHSELLTLPFDRNGPLNAVQRIRIESSASIKELFGFTPSWKLRVTTQYPLPMHWSGYRSLDTGIPFEVQSIVTTITAERDLPFDFSALVIDTADHTLNIEWSGVIDRSLAGSIYFGSAGWLILRAADSIDWSGLSPLELWILWNVTSKLSTQLILNWQIFGTAIGVTFPVGWRVFRSLQILNFQWNVLPAQLFDDTIIIHQPISSGEKTT